MRVLRIAVLAVVFSTAVIVLPGSHQPSAVVAPPTQFGLASYYGPGFHGEITASGRSFNQWSMVAAHRTLPLGTVVRVTNLQNGRQVVVRIVDRGPYGRNRRKGTIIDLSTGAAQRLRSIKPGLVPVRVEVLE
jgi:rare lipoprotein A